MARTQSKIEHNLNPAFSEEIRLISIAIRGGVNVIDGDTLSRALGAGRKPEYPEINLMMAIFEEAHVTVITPPRDDTNARLNYLKAWAWVRSDDSEWIFSFRSICEALGWEPDYIRAGILRKANACIERG